MIGTEHEYSINNHDLKAMPVSDLIIKEISGKIQNEFSFETVGISKELQKHVIEFKPLSPSESISNLENQIFEGLKSFYKKTNNKYKLLGLGMHPTLKLSETSFWNHDEREVFDTYDRVFNLRQHGWMNIQALQVNIEYSTEEDLVRKHNKLRTLLPYLVAITASSPIVEGNVTGYMDNRLLYYKKNQKEIPEICGNLIPEKLNKSSDYEKLLEKMYVELRKKDAEVLCEEWVNSRALIVRRGRKCVEIKIMDEQESVHADMAVSAFINCLLRVNDLKVAEDDEAIIELTDIAIKSGTRKLKAELESLYKKAVSAATEEEKSYLIHIQNRIQNGNLSEVILKKYNSEKDISKILVEAESCLRENKTMF